MGGRFSGGLHQIIFQILEAGVFFFHNDYLADGEHEVDNDECYGKAPAVGLVSEEINQEEEQAGHDFDGAGENVAGDELPRLALRFIAKDDVQGEKGDEEEKEHDERHRRGGVGEKKEDKQGGLFEK